VSIRQVGLLVNYRIARVTSR